MGRQKQKAVKGHLRKTAPTVKRRNVSESTVSGGTPASTPLHFLPILQVSLSSAVSVQSRHPLRGRNGFFDFSSF